jgi:hypothetical protein
LRLNWFGITRGLPVVGVEPMPERIGSSGRTRTYNPLVNSYGVDLGLRLRLSETCYDLQLLRVVLRRRGERTIATGCEPILCLVGTKIGTIVRHVNGIREEDLDRD